MKKFFALSLFVFVILYNVVALPKSKKSNSKSSVKPNTTGIDLYRKDKSNEVYNYYDREKISKPLMPTSDTIQPFHETKKKLIQQQAFLDKKYYLPAKPKNKTELGIGIGQTMLLGDVPFNTDIMNNLGFHIEARRAVAYSFSLRAMYCYQQSTNRKVSPDYEIAKFYKAMNGTYGPDLRGINNGSIIPDVQTYFHNINVDLIYTIGNVRYHKERTKLNFDLFIGLGAVMFKNKMNLLDAAGNGYKHQEAFDIINKYNISGEDTRLRDQEIKVVLEKEFDKTYESAGDLDPTLMKPLGFSLVPSFSFGAGMNYRISKLINIGLFSRVNIVGTDYLDGLTYNGGGYPLGGKPSLSTGNDVLIYNALNLAYNLGGPKQLEPMYWLNPLMYSKSMMNSMSPSSVDFKDDDDDGVPNSIDKQLDTKKGMPVDVKGIAIDSDKDGLADGEDKEPFSAPGFPINELGVAIVPPSPCCNDSIKKMTNFNSNNGGSVCNEVTLPSILFNRDNFGTDRMDFIPIIHIIGEKMQQCPNAKIMVSGINDKENANNKYNEQLSYNRANEVINFLTDNYGISRDRFIMKYNQSGKGEVTKDRRVDFKFAKDGDAGSSNPPAPHPGLKAGNK